MISFFTLGLEGVGEKQKRQKTSVFTAKCVVVIVRNMLTGGKMGNRVTEKCEVIFLTIKQPYSAVWPQKNKTH